jgi:ribulose-5-phosphate 4-epimerase/fuculose-1-phosphate aldolase
MPAKPAAVRPIRPVKSKTISAAEWKVRCNLAAAYRLAAHFGWTDLQATHISARVPGRHEHFLMNPYGSFFHEITASSLVKIDLDGKLIDPPDGRVNAAGFTIHSAIHAARPEVGCVLHLHTIAGVAVCSQKHGLLPINHAGLLFRNRVGYHDYEGLTFNLDERPRLVASLGRNVAMILHNHGTLTVGETVGEAFYWAYNLEKACRIQIASLAGNPEQIVPSQAVQEHYTKQTEYVGRLGEQIVWPGLLRMADQLFPAYKT